MNKDMIIVIVLIVLVVLAVAQAVKLNTVSKTSTASGEIDTTGWTANEIMNYEMHGTIPARAGSSSASTGSSGGMVGGC